MPSGSGQGDKRWSEEHPGRPVKGGGGASPEVSVPQRSEAGAHKQ